jgi:hypothetical protein
MPPWVAANQSSADNRPHHTEQEVHRDRVSLVS